MTRGREALSCSGVVVALLVLTSVAAAQAPAGTFAVVEHGTPRILPSGTSVEVPVVLRNLEAEPWGVDGDWAVASHWLSPDGEVVVWDGARTPLPGPVAPGETVAVEARLATPAVGHYLLVWDVVHEGVRWLGDGQRELLRVPVEIRASHAFTLVNGRAPRLEGAGASRRCRVTVRNDGIVEWPAGGRVALAYHWSSPRGEMIEWEGVRTAMPRRVPPGDSVELEATIVAPEAPGHYLLQWDMVEEGVCWFSERDPSPTSSADVWVYPAVPVPAVAWLGLLVTSSLAVVVVRRRGWQGTLPGGHLLWGVGTLVCAQMVVLDEVGVALTPAGTGFSVATAAALLLPSLALRPARREVVVTVVVVVGLALLYADVLYLRFFGDLLSVAAVRATGQADEVRASIVELVAWRDLWLWAPLLVLPLLHRLRRAVDEPVRVRKLLALTLAAVMVLAAGVGLWRFDRGFKATGQVFRQVFLAREIGVLNAHALDLGSSVARWVSQGPLEETELDRVVSWFKQRGPQRAATGEWAGVARGRNLIMIQVESLQSFVLDMTAGGEPVTPLLSSWRNEALWFSNVTDQTEQGRSSDAELTTQVSLLPLTAGAAVFPYGDNRFSSLAGTLAETGYHTLSAVPFDGSFWNRRVSHRSFGYAERLFDEAFVPGEVIGWGLNDRDFLAQMAVRLEQAPKPFAAWLITLSLHHPFEGFPAHLASLDVGEHAGTPFGNYLQTMHFFDRALSGFVARLEASGLLADSLLVVWGDHDAGFEWSRATAAALGARPDAAGWYLSQQVPLFVLVPGVVGLCGERNLPAGHVDVAPTVLALLGADPSRKAFVGRNLLGEPGDEPVVGEYRCWRTSNRLFLQGGPRLEDGRCLELPSLSPLPGPACAEAFAAAAEQVRISEVVLEHDLQEEVSRRLDAVPGSG